MMGNKIVAICLILAIAGGDHVASGLFGLGELSEIGKMTFPQIAEKFGHPAEEKDVITEDGYILTTYHIPGDKSRAVLLIHGNTAAGDCWITRGETSLALTLARLGYDVWVTNLRGSRYSRRHCHLDPDTQPERFFNFSFYEQGVYDMPATVDFVLQETGQRQLLAVCHSVGTTLLYIMGAEKPEYNDKIKVGISLAPICFLENLRGIGSLIPLFGPTLLGILEVLNIREVLAYQHVAPLLKALCLEPLGYDICIRFALFGLFGYDEKGYEPEFMPDFLGHFPGGSSTKMFRHLLQVIQNNEFTKYDYGKAKNLAIYNSSEPPSFDLSKVTMKSALIMGTEDYLGTVEDSKRLNASLPNVVHYQVLPYEKFNHFDFIWGRYMPDNFYPHLLAVIEKYI